MQPFLEPAERLMLIRDGLYNTDSVVQQRASMVLELDRGSNYMPAVARSLKCHRRTVKYWHLRYLERRTPATLHTANDPRESMRTGPTTRRGLVFLSRWRKHTRADACRGRPRSGPR